MATGYHFTTIKNWRRIQKEGLKPALIMTPPLAKDLPLRKGIWFFHRALEGNQLLGMLLNILTLKESWDVCELEVDTTGLSHLQFEGDIGLHIWYSFDARPDCKKWLQKEPVWIITDPIPPDRIKIRRHWLLGD